MIRIARTIAAPGVLAQGEASVQGMHNERQAKPDVAGTKAEPFKFDDKIYGDQDVKNALKTLQHEKCAYCEGDFLAFCYGDIEHYRPKGYSQQRIGGATIRPGYYWLAYDWDNLLLSCELCNRARKRNVFPLRDPANRADTPEKIAQEDPLILDPSGPDDPRDHIRFVGNVPEAITDAGEQTIALLGLDRPKLNGLRLVQLGYAKALRTIVRFAARPGADAELIAEAVEAEAELLILQAAHSPFSAMVCDAVAPP